MTEHADSGSGTAPTQHEATALHAWSRRLGDQARQLHDHVELQRREFRRRLAQHLLSSYERDLRRTSSRDAKLATLERLSALHDLQAILQEHIFVAVADSRARNATWAEIGGALGVTRQSAHQRYASTIKQKVS
jgi:hypothetical protein